MRRSDRHIPPTVPARPFRGRTVGALLAPVMKPVLKRRGFRDMEILRHWPTIVGAELAAFSRPEGIRRGDPEGGVLIVRVEGAMAVEVQHLEPRILARLADYYGDTQIKRLAIKQAPLPPPPPESPQRPPLSKEAVAAAEARLEAFPAGRLRRALARLGARMTQKEEV